MRNHRIYKSFVRLRSYRWAFLGIFILMGAVLCGGAVLAHVPTGSFLKNPQAVQPTGGVLQATSGALGSEVSLLPLLPSLWHTGDTHAHIQICSNEAPQPPDITLANLLEEQQEGERQVTFAQIWGTFNLNIPNFITSYVPLVTGSEHPISQGDPDYIIQFGFEASQFPADQFGHIQCAGITSASFPFEVNYPAPILDFCRAQGNNALTGYAHVVWPLSYNLQELVLNPNFGGIGYMAPTDVALGKADFLETTIVHNDIPQADWRGMYYKFLNAGLRPALTAGRDNTCQSEPRNDMTVARVANAPLSFNGWLDAVRMGRTTVSEGKRFLNITVDDVEIGGSVSLSAPGTVTASVTYIVAEDSTGTMSIVKDGVALPTTYPYALLAGESTSFDLSIQMDKSGWIVAHADGVDNQDAHTAAIYVIVGNQPICNGLDAGYWSEYSTMLTNSLNGFVFNSSTERTEATTHIANGKKVFDALKACALPSPQGVSRYGTSIPACKGPIQINVRDIPTVGNSNFAITNINAPANTSGWLVVGLAPTNRGPIFAKGAELFIDPSSIISILPVFSNGGGYHELPIQFPASASGVTLYFQYFWKNTSTCASQTSGLSASDALAVTVQ